MFKFVPTLICSLLVGFLCVQRSAGFFVVLVILFLVPWLAYSGYLIWRKPLVRISQLLKICIWCIVITVVFATHEYYRIRSRDAANAVASAIVSYRIKGGAFPARLTDAGVQLPKHGGQWRISYAYGYGYKEPFLSYPSTFNPFDSYSYDFAKSQWVFYAD